MSLKNILSGLLDILQDNAWHRKKTANRITRLYEQFQKNPQKNKGCFLEIERAARNGNRFARCYALSTLGRLGDKSRNALPTIMRGLQSSDPFVRDAAAEAIWHIASWCTADTLQIISDYKNNLTKASRDHQNEGAANYLNRTLNILEKHNK